MYSVLCTEQNVKSTTKNFSNFVAFSENPNFTAKTELFSLLCRNNISRTCAQEVNDILTKRILFVESWEGEIWYETIKLYFINLTWPPWPQKGEVPKKDVGATSSSLPRIPKIVFFWLECHLILKKGTILVLRSFPCPQTDGKLKNARLNASIWVRGPCV